MANNFSPEKHWEGKVSKMVDSFSLKSPSKFVFARLIILPRLYVSVGSNLLALVEESILVRQGVNMAVRIMNSIKEANMATRLLLYTDKNGNTMQPMKGEKKKKMREEENNT